MGGLPEVWVAWEGEGGVCGAGACAVLGLGVC